eukprot:83524_1
MMSTGYISTLLSVFLTININGQPPDWPYRPTFHFVPNPPGWMQDMSGPFYDANTKLYHIMPDITQPLQWGHAISTDLLHWKNLPIAITNTESYDKGGVFTGSVTIVNGEPIAMYSVSTNNRMCLSRPTDTNDVNLTKWTQYDTCVLNAPQDGPMGRDPITSWTTDNGTTWVFAYATQGPGKNGGAVTYKTRDWINWQRAHFLSYSNYTGGWECPDFFELSIKEQSDGISHVMKVSKQGKDYWAVGTYDAETTEFIPYDGKTHNEAWDCTDCIFDYGNLYASKSFYDAKNDRQILWGWVTEQRNCNNLTALGWCGAQILPREIKLLSADNSPTGIPRILTYPIEEFNSLRIESTKFEMNNVTINEGQIMFLDENKIRGDTLDIEVKWRSGGDCQVWVLSNDDGSLKTRIGVNFKDVPNVGTFYMDSVDGVFRQHLVPGWNAMDPITLRIIVDHSIMNVFVNDGITVCSQRYYPKYTDFKVALMMWNHGNASDKCIVDSFTAYNVSAALEPPNISKS